MLAAFWPVDVRARMRFLSSLVAFDVIHATIGLLIAFGAVLMVADVQAWRVVSPLFNRERLITGSKG